jgi:hypothetical protein
MASSVQFLLILCILGNSLRAQPQLGFIGAVMALVWLTLQLVLSAISADRERDWFGILLPLSMAMPYELLLVINTVWLQLAANLFVLAGLALLFAHGYGSARLAAVNGRVVDVSQCTGAKGTLRVQRITVHGPDQHANMFVPVRDAFDQVNTAACLETAFGTGICAPIRSITPRNGKVHWQPAPIGEAEPRFRGAPAPRACAR